MQFNGVNKKSACVPLVVSGVDTYAHVLEFDVLVDRSVEYVQVFSCVFVVAAHRLSSSSYCVGAHGWVARIS